MHKIISNVNNFQIDLFDLQITSTHTPDPFRSETRRAPSTLPIYAKLKIHNQTQFSVITGTLIYLGYLEIKIDYAVSVKYNVQDALLLSISGVLSALRKKSAIVKCAINFFANLKFIYFLLHV